MLIHFKGLITKQDFTKALVIHFQQQQKWLTWVLTAFLVIILASLIVTIIQKPELKQSMLPAFAFSLIFFTFPWWIPYLQASAYNQQGNIYRNPIEGFVDDNGITIAGRNHKVETRWSAISHFRRSGNMILLYQGKSGFNILTKSLFTEADWAEFIRVIEEKLKK